MKIVLSIVLIFLGLAGLAMSACGIMFLPMQGMGLIGLIPGMILIWAAYAIWKQVRPQEPAPAQEDHPAE